MFIRLPTAPGQEDCQFVDHVAGGGARRSGGSQDSVSCETSVTVYGILGLSTDGTIFIRLNECIFIVVDA